MNTLPIDHAPKLTHPRVQAIAPMDAIAMPQPQPAQTAAVRCSDGRLLAATWFEPPRGQPIRAIAVIGSATAVPASYYRHFAQWMAGRGYAVLSFDYRGIAASRDALQPGEDVRLRDCARVDMAAALHAADRRRQLEQSRQGREIGLLWVGHSLGGNAIGLIPGFEEKVDAVLGVAAQVAYIGHWSGLAKLQAWIFFHWMLPGLVAALGHGPSTRPGACPRAATSPGSIQWKKIQAWSFARPDQWPR